MYISISKAAYLLGGSATTLQRWDANGLLMRSSHQFTTGYGKNKMLAKFSQKSPVTILIDFFSTILDKFAMKS